MLLKERYNWTNEMCAEQCKVCLSTWKKLIHGDIDNPRMEVLRSIGKGFGVPIDLLMDERNTYMMTEKERQYVLVFRDLPMFMQEDIQAFILTKRDEWHRMCEKDYRFRVREMHRIVSDAWTVDEIIAAEKYIESLRVDE